MKKILHICIFLILVSFLTSSEAQTFLRTNGKAIVNEAGDTVLLRGMGLGGWMVQEGYMMKTASFANPQHQIRAKIQELIGETATQEFYEAWLSNHVRKIDIDSLKAWGFNSVRLPMHYNLYTLPIEEEPVPGEQTWLTKGFEMTDSLISWCKQNEMYVILDLHAAPGGQGYDEGISDYDPNKPSLWESPANQFKTVALWRRLAERYADEPVVAGYDLINETNWNMSGNAPLRNLYEQITASIREVDTNHIIFIEGNWFANDFTGLTPPWDDNMVYSPHKYWSINDKNSIQWVLDMRDQYNIPLYLGESGENSNVWFRDAIHLLEEEGIGWAWWPMKKIDDIAGPLSVLRTPDYQTLLNYWENGGAPPNALFAKAALMEVAENLKLENCIQQKDVVDAMFRQVYSDETIPFNTQDIPGFVDATDFDMGRNGSAYFDLQVANYHVSTGNFTAWNNGWAYRNDGVDIEKSTDAMGNGFNVGWIEDGEWMQYDVNVTEAAVYDVHVRVASLDGGGNFNFSADGADISTPFYVAPTGGWQNWQNRTISNVILDPSVKKLRFHANEGGFNLSGFDFVPQGPTSSIDADFLSGYTLDEHQIQVNMNKPLTTPLPDNILDEFTILATSGGSISLNDVSIHPDNPRSLIFSFSHTLLHTDIIKISYEGDQIQAEDGTTLQAFSLKDIQNRLPIIHPIPGKVEAEDFFFQIGVSLENTFDTGGGKNIAHLDAGDYLDYYINVAQYGTYQVAYRTAAQSETGALKLQRIDEDGFAYDLHHVSFPPTGDWQAWETTETTAVLNPGRHHIRILITEPQFNLNWFEFSFLTSTETIEGSPNVNIFPNPTDDVLYFQMDKPENYEVTITDALGRRLIHTSLGLSAELDVSMLKAGVYVVVVSDGEFRVSKKIVIH